MNPAKFERRERRKCAKKLVYKTPVDALNKILLIWEQNKKWLRSYECVWCGNIHLTSDKRRTEGEI